MTMTWEAFRLTSKSPSELLGTLGPHGVEHLIRQALDAVWREYPEEARSYPAVRKRVEEVWARNMKVWGGIKKPSPAAFFEDLLPCAADGFVRQAMVLTWMMLPRSGGRDIKETRKIVTRIFERNMEAWEEDHRVFTDGGGKKKAGVARATKTAGKVRGMKAAPVAKAKAKGKGKAKKKSVARQRG